MIPCTRLSIGCPQPTWAVELLFLLAFLSLSHFVEKSDWHASIHIHYRQKNLSYT
jgi:hypothetical protein